LKKILFELVHEVLYLVESALCIIVLGVRFIEAAEELDESSSYVLLHNGWAKTSIS
jgi:hypothetical protein